MAERAPQTPEELPAPLRRQLRLTRLALLAEAFARAFWPLWSLALAALAAVLLGLPDLLPLAALRWAAGGSAALMLAALARGLLTFRWPGPEAALHRLEAALPARPLSALTDRQAIGADDPASRALWQAHRRRMAEAARAARAAPPRPDLARRDPFALRYLALTLFAIGLIFGNPARLPDLPRALEGLPGQGPDLASGPAWEGWIRPPAHTGKPTLYLPDLPAGGIRVPVGSRALIRLYGRSGALRVAQALAPPEAAPADGAAPAEAAPADGPAPAAPAGADQVEFTIARSGPLAIEGPGGRAWQVEIIPDTPPEIALAGPLERHPGGEMRLPFRASDDYGVSAGQARITLDLQAVPRRFGLAPPPEPRDAILLDLPMPYSGDRRQVEGVLVEELARHPWAGLPVILTLSAEDAAGQRGSAPPAHVILPGRRFFDPLAAAIVEQRRDLLWSRANGQRAARLLRAISHRPEEIFDRASDYLKLRHAIHRMEAALDAKGRLDPATRDALADALWEIALGIEEGDLSDARARLRAARERLQQAIRDGASQSEIDELMRQMQQAMRDYLRQLAEEQQGREGDQTARQQGETMQITPDQLQQMLDRIQELMEQGRMAEAQQALEQLSQMLENMRIARGGAGQGGDQALGGLAETLRRQQDLSDETFRQMQRGQGGESQADGQGRQGEGQGDEPRGQGGAGPGGPLGADGPEGDNGRGARNGPGGQGQGGSEATPAPGDPGGNAPGAGLPGARPGERPGEGAGGGALARRQEELRRELERQLGTLPGDADAETLEALRDAERAMREAERALRDGDGSGALDRQAEALEALREGMRGLARNLAENSGGESGLGREGRGEGEGSRGGRRLDPLGRSITGNGSPATGREMLGGAEAARRARELIEEIRRRAAERAREQLEREYLQRLLERFDGP